MTPAAPCSAGSRASSRTPGFSTSPRRRAAGTLRSSTGSTRQRGVAVFGVGSVRCGPPSEAGAGRGRLPVDRYQRSPPSRQRHHQPEGDARALRGTTRRRPPPTATSSRRSRRGASSSRSPSISNGPKSSGRGRRSAPTARPSTPTSTRARRFGRDLGTLGDRRRLRAVIPKPLAGQLALFADLSEHDSVAFSVPRSR